jgi:hypothetical protein
MCECVFLRVDTGGSHLCIARVLIEYGPLDREINASMRFPERKYRKYFEWYFEVPRYF